jgi:hypothetical protein
MIPQTRTKILDGLDFDDEIDFGDEGAKILRAPKWGRLRRPYIARIAEDLALLASG